MEHEMTIGKSLFDRPFNCNYVVFEPSKGFLNHKLGYTLYLSCAAYFATSEEAQQAIKLLSLEVCTILFIDTLNAGVGL